MVPAADPPVNPTADAPAPGDGFVQSFARGLGVLRAFGADHPALTLTEAAARSGLTRAGARRILLTLQHLGYVQADGRHFRLTPRVLDLGFAYLSSQPVWRLAQPAMEQLTADLRESCSAAVLDGSDIVYVLRVPAPQVMSITLSVGSRLPAYCTSMGRVLLAALPPADAAARLAAAPRPAHTARTLTALPDLLAELDRVRAEGHALVDEELEAGLVSMAVPVHDRGGRVVAAINLGAQRQRTPPEALRARMLPRLRDAAAQIDRLLQAAGG
jgi:IclR family transcriptional regulator, pca regulon regulatory protein